MPHNLDLLGDLVARALKQGADAADAVLIDSVSVSVGWRLGQLERMERSESGDVGLRVLMGKRQALVSSSDRSPQALELLVERAVSMARVVPEDQYAGLADPHLLATSFPDLDCCDPVEPGIDTLLEMVKKTEDAARAHPGITNSEGADAGWGRSDVAIVASNGFSHAYGVTQASLSVAVLAGGADGGMERDYDYTSAVHMADLRDGAEVGTEAARRAVRRLNGKKVKTAQVPVIFDPRVSRGLLGSFVGAINGAGVARGTTFLKDFMGKPVFSKGVRIIDDPWRKRGLRSRPCDGEGVATKPLTLVEDGILQSWILDCRSARQLGLVSTGHASRGTSSPPSPSSSNLYMEAGPVTVAEMLGDIQSGFYVTDLFGQGVNGVTGDYSRGAAGFWIDNGELTHAVSEVTIASNMKEMFTHLTPANDLVFRHGIDCPTLRIDGMIVAGR